VKRSLKGFFSHKELRTEALKWRTVVPIFLGAVVPIFLGAVFYASLIILTLRMYDNLRMSDVRKKLGSLLAVCRHTTGLLSLRIQKKAV